jgi:D-tyrosyl-tRNA(Tyr) deacylase
MRALLQRVRRARVAVGGRICGEIGAGLLLLVGILADDTDDDAAFIARKAVQLRVFDDAEGMMNRALADVGGGLLVVSQFTLYASTRKGNRPSWSQAASPEVAAPKFARFVATLEAALGKPVAQGEFGAAMEVELVNDGPVTILLDSRLRE